MQTDIPVQGNGDADFPRVNCAFEGTHGLFGGAHFCVLMRQSAECCVSVWSARTPHASRSSEANPLHLENLRGTERRMTENLFGFRATCARDKSDGVDWPRQGQGPGGSSRCRGGCRQL